MNSYRIIMFEPNKNAGRIKFQIPYTMKDERIVFKKIDGSYYHPNQRLWSLPNTVNHLNQVKTLFNDKLVVEQKEKIVSIPEIQVTEQIQQELDRHYQKLKLKSYSDSTIRTYQTNLKQFFGCFNEHDFSQLTKEQIEDFIYELIQRYKISEQKQNMMFNAIKSYYEHVLGKPIELYSFSLPKRSKQLLNILSQAVVLAIIHSLKNIQL